MADPSVGSNVTEGAACHRVADVQHELPSHLTGRIQARGINPRRRRKLHRQRTCRTTPRASVERDETPTGPQQ